MQCDSALEPAALFADLQVPLRLCNAAPLGPVHTAVLPEPSLESPDARGPPASVPGWSPAELCTQAGGAVLRNVRLARSGKRFVYFNEDKLLRRARRLARHSSLEPGFSVVNLTLQDLFDRRFEGVWRRGANNE